MEIIKIPRRDQQDLLLAALKNFFGDFDHRLLERSLPLLEWIEVDNGEVLLDEGAPGHELFFVVSGRLRATARGADGAARLVGEIARGETVGEMAAITGEPRTATVTALRPSVLVRLSRQGFETLLIEHPLLSVRLTRLIIERLRRSNRAEDASRRPVNIALLAVTDGVDAPGLGHGLAQRMARWGNAFLVTSAMVRERFGEKVLRATRDAPDLALQLTRWLDETESRHDTLLFVADAEDSAWTRRCLRRADEVLLLANAVQPPDLHPLERRLLTGDSAISSAACRLVLVQPRSTTLPRNSAAWLDRRDVAAHVHLREGSGRDLDRLARILSGRAVGLVLSGGGARGFAHLGVYRALVELGVEIDYVGGTSIGAGVGSMIALDLPPQEAVERFRRLFSAKPVSDYNLLPIVSLIAGRRLEAHLERTFRGTDGSQPDLEDAWKTFYCIASSYSYAREVVIHRGPMAKMVRASLSIPAFLPPVFHRGDALVDGAIFNNFPTDVMAHSGVGLLIGVDLKQGHFGPVQGDAVPRAWELILRRWARPRGAGSNVPSIVGMLYHAPTLHSTSRQLQSSHLADVLIRPDLRSVGTLQWNAFDRAIGIGYRSAMAELQRFDGIGGMPFAARTVSVHPAPGPAGRGENRFDAPAGIQLAAALAIQETS